MLFHDNVIKFAKAVPRNLDFDVAILRRDRSFSYNRLNIMPVIAKLGVQLRFQCLLKQVFEEFLQGRLNLSSGEVKLCSFIKARSSCLVHKLSFMSTLWFDCFLWDLVFPFPADLRGYTFYFTDPSDDWVHGISTSSNCSEKPLKLCTFSPIETRSDDLR